MPRGFILMPHNLKSILPSNQNSLPFIQLNLEAKLTTLSVDNTHATEEYTFKINTNDSFPGNRIGNAIFPLVILTEYEAYHLIKRFNDRVYVVFKKCTDDSETYHLLANNGNEIQEFDFCMKSASRGSPYQRNVFQHTYCTTGFNLKDKNGATVFPGAVFGSFGDFIESSAVMNQFGSLAKLSHVKMLSCAKAMHARNNPQDLQDEKLWVSMASKFIPQFILEDPSLVWLPELTPQFQDIAIFYFINSFIYIHENTRINDIDDFIAETIHNKHDSPLRLNYYSHYRLAEIERNLSALRWLSQQGCNPKAALVLAAIRHAGLYQFNEKPPTAKNMIDMILAQHTKPLFKRQEQPKLFCDHTEYLELTQDPSLFPEKAVRDYYLLWLYKGCSNTEKLNTVLSDVEIDKAIFLKQPFYSDYTLFSCVILNEQRCMQALSGIKTILHYLIGQNRLRLASHIISMLPEEVLKAKDEAGHNILHKLLESLSINKLRGFAFTTKMIKFIYDHTPEMLMEPDHSGRTPYEDLQALDPALALHVPALPRRSMVPSNFN